MAINPEDSRLTISGYHFGTPTSAQSSVSAEELLHLEPTVGWTVDDEELLRRHAGLFESKAKQMVDSWHAVIGAQPHLQEWFTDPDGKPDAEYKSAVKRRFVQFSVLLFVELGSRFMCTHLAEHSP